MFLRNNDERDEFRSRTYRQVTGQTLESANHNSTHDSFDDSMFTATDVPFPPLSPPVGRDSPQQDPPSRPVSRGNARREGINQRTSNHDSSPADHVAGDKNSKLACLAAAHQQPIDAPVCIPLCLLHTHPRMRRMSQAGQPGHDASVSVRSSGVSVRKDTTRLGNMVAPVTKDSLRELELPAIQNNLSLRIDLCFDHELFFQRISGNKGEEKQQKASDYYDDLKIELRTYSHNLNGSCVKCRDVPHTHNFEMPSRLVAFFSALRDLLEMLVPEADKEDVISHVDVDWLTRQVRLGVFDAPRFSAWLSKLLMTHCAPMRDEMCREMHGKITGGAESNDMDLLIDGLETLLNLLENMKLDVANHQVRSFKLLLIADTVPFLKDCFSKMIESGQFNRSGSCNWFKSLHSHATRDEPDFERFIIGLVNICSSDSEVVPQTFAYDKDRIRALQNDVIDFAQLGICMNFYQDLTLEQIKLLPTSAARLEVSGRVLQLITTEDGTSEGVGSHVDAIATEIARAVASTSVSCDFLPTQRGSQGIDFQYAIDSLQKKLEQDHKQEMYEVKNKLVERTSFHASQLQRLDALQLSNCQRTWSLNRSLEGFPLAPDIEDIARRLAHIALIHWEVWSGLVYLDN